MPQFGIESTTQDPHYPRKDVGPLERPSDFAHTTDHPLFPAPNLAVSAQIMRRILVDSARAHLADKRGGRLPHVQLDDSVDASPQSSEDLVALDDALNALEEMDPRKARVVELRFFAGLSVEQTAEALNISAPSVKRDWKLAKAWLTRELSRR